ncbi:MAG: FecR domain-containing protein [Thermomicrobiales bacterium]
MVTDSRIAPHGNGSPSFAPVPRSAHAQTRSAWRILIISFACFSLLAAGVTVSYTTYRANATKPRSGRVAQILTGTQSQVRSRQQSFWHDITEGGTVSEGDTIRTGDDTRIKVSLFDDSQVELSANTEVTFDRLRASQYIAKNAAIQMQEAYGRLVVYPSTDTTYDHVLVAVHTRGSTIEARQPGTSFRVLVLPGQLTDPGRVDVSVLSGPDVIVEGAGQSVTVANGQQTIVSVGAAPTAPSVKQRELIENGTFQLGANAHDQMPTHWEAYADDGGDGGTVRATEEIVPETVRGQPVNALHISRTGGNVDSDLIGIKQPLAFSELDEFDSVVLSADVKIVSHSLSGGGTLGSEYPVVFLIRYVDASNNPIEIGRAFYTQNDDGNRTATSVLQGTQIKPGVWSETFHWELKQAHPVPYKLVSIQVYASGHDYDAYVANISIVAK